MEFRSKVLKTYEKVLPYIRKTPLVYSDYFSRKLDRNIYFKLENIQYTGSFKIRGALNKVLSLGEEDKKKTLITASGGNHGLGVCYAAQKFRMKAVVYLPASTPELKINKIRQLGGEVIIYGDNWDEANKKAIKEAGLNDMIYIHPFSDEQVIEGQATLACEILEEKPDIDTIVCSIGGGGLISGIARYVKAVKNNKKVLGVETEGADSMYLSLKAKQLVELEAITSIAESLGARMVTEKTFGYVEEFVDDLFVVTDTDALKALVEILQQEKQLVEPASSCSLSAILKNKSRINTGETICIILCGGNFAVDTLKKYI